MLNIRSRAEEIQRVATRIKSRLATLANGCIVWTGSCHGKGYGQTCVFNRTARIHRVVYESVHGPIPKGMIVCHTCDNPPCCNIDHLWLGTIKQNGLDASEKKRCRMQKRTHCFRSHELTAENIYISRNGARHCKTCARIACRVRSGWPEHALEIPAQAVGQRPDFGRLKKLPPPKHLNRDGRENYAPSKDSKP